ncbi:hypothetical protein ACP70R_003213 [Stipagrostis hirtigluma subsp. patula]
MGPDGKKREELGLAHSTLVLNAHAAATAAVAGALNRSATIGAPCAAALGRPRTAVSAVPARLPHLALVPPARPYVVDKHLSILAKQHVETRFIKVHAEKAPFLTEKLRIVVLPTLALVKNAKVEDYVVGFDELGGKDDFSTEDLEERLAKAEVIFLDGEGPANPSKNVAKRSVRQSDTGNSSDSD